MTHRQLKAGYFTLAGMNTLATTVIISTILFFFLRDHFGFGDIAAISGSRRCPASSMFSPRGSAGNSPRGYGRVLPRSRSVFSA